jgi:hypothetical protein
MPARRVVELAVWDVLTLSSDEAPAGQFREGLRFQVRLVLHVRISRSAPGLRLLVFVRFRICFRRRRMRAAWKAEHVYLGLHDRSNSQVLFFLTNVDFS